MFQKRIGFPVVFSIAFALGLFISINPLDIHLGSDRNPASTQKISDLSQLTGDELIQVSKAKFLEGLTFSRNTEGYSFSFGQFIFKSSNDQPKFTCEEFTTIETFWSGEGIMNSGEPPVLKIVSPCAGGETQARTSSAAFPYRTIYREAAGDGAFQFEAYPGQSWELTNMSSTWPEGWILNRVVLSGAEVRLDISVDEIVEILGRPVVMRIEK